MNDIYLDKDTSISNDGMQWIVSAWGDSKNKKTGKVTRVVTRRNYFGTLEGVSKHLTNVALMQLWDNTLEPMKEKGDELLNR